MFHTPTKRCKARKEPPKTKTRRQALPAQKRSYQALPIKIITRTPQIDASSNAELSVKAPCQGKDSQEYYNHITAKKTCDSNHGDIVPQSALQNAQTPRNQKISGTGENIEKCPWEDRSFLDKPLVTQVSTISKESADRTNGAEKRPKMRLSQQETAKKKGCSPEDRLAVTNVMQTDNAHLFCLADEQKGNYMQRILKNVSFGGCMKDDGGETINSRAALFGQGAGMEGANGQTEEGSNSTHMLAQQQSVKPISKEETSNDKNDLAKAANGVGMNVVREQDQLPKNSHPKNVKKTSTFSEVIEETNKNQQECRMNIDWHTSVSPGRLMPNLEEITRIKRTQGASRDQTFPEKSFEDLEALKMGQNMTTHGLPSLQAVEDRKSVV